MAKQMAGGDIERLLLYFILKKKGGQFLRKLLKDELFQENDIFQLLRELGRAYNVKQKHDQVLLLIAISQFYHLAESNGASWGIKQAQLNYDKKCLTTKNHPVQKYIRFLHHGASSFQKPVCVCLDGCRRMQNSPVKLKR
ncbi:hypothetical protein BLNAU_8197 [Blattamonas nauphoetae]|uniref:Uncharacterized protein n=1 Tax=Blattamonas nauphoetae TaxID=2049346 RepID=A0ABQ9XZM3_9EUKA|nr:hypothetical protein BLNAU_8197 [Blattamonas nauphoetae]